MTTTTTKTPTSNTLMVDICNDVVVAEGGKDVVAYINNLSFEKFQLVSKVGLNL